jgi:hypothetical protein
MMKKESTSKRKRLPDSSSKKSIHSSSEGEDQDYSSDNPVIMAGILTEKAKNRKSTLPSFTLSGKPWYLPISNLAS